VNQPNILIFMPDQLRADCLGCFGNPVVQTPNIDALAARGTRFDNAYVNHPVCSPSRVNLMTGWYPHTRGHRTLTHLVQPHEPNLLRYFKEHGYHVAWAGARGDMFAPGVTESSTHFAGWLTRPVREQSSMGPQFPESSPLYHAFYHGRRPGQGPWLDFDEAVVRTAETWLAGRPDGPWILFVPLIFPHLPFEVEEPWYGMYDPRQMPKPIAYADASGKSGFVELLHRAGHLDAVTPEQWAEITRTYYGMISRVDDQLGRILRAVEQSGAAERTLTLFFADHGEYLGDFGLVEKWPSGLDECLVRNPLIVAGPGVASGQVADGFVEMVDILPTLLEVSGIEARHTHFGRSFLPLLRDASLPHREFAVSQGGFRKEDAHLLERPGGEYRLKGELQHAHPELVGKAFALRDAAWTYVYRLYEGPELYDRANDRNCVRNLANDPRHRAVLEDCERRLLRWLADTSDVIPWTADPRFPTIQHGQHEPFGTL
jgi:arylsulfatase A-like enzyme